MLHRYAPLSGPEMDRRNEAQDRRPQTYPETIPGDLQWRRKEPMRINSRAVALVSIAALVASACSSSATPSPVATTTVTAAPTPVVTPVVTPVATAKPCTVGVSWNNYAEERWAKWDEPAIQKALTKGGAKYISNDAKSSADTQLSNVDALINLQQRPGRQPAGRGTAEGQELRQLRRHQGQQGRRERGLPPLGHGPGRSPGCGPVDRHPQERR